MSENITESIVKTEDEQKKNFDQNDDDWIEQKDGQVVKLEIGESIEGILIHASVSEKYNIGIYKIESNDDEIPNIILGTKMLDRKMANVDIGTNVKIIRNPDKPTDKGQAMHVFRVYTKTEG